MKLIKKLFSARALATTVAAGMLLHTTVVALVDGCISVSTSTGTATCNEPYETPCVAPGIYWCCPYPYKCDIAIPLEGGGWMGKCCP
jgi:hypothetical protein